VFFWAQIFTIFRQRNLDLLFFLVEIRIFFEKEIFQNFDIKKMRKKTLLSAKYILDSNQKKRKKNPPIALGFLPVWCGSLILLPTFGSFIMMPIYMDKGYSISVLIYRGR